MSSGIIVSTECKEKFDQLKLRKSYKYIIFKLTADFSQIVIDKTAESSTYDDFLEELPENQPRYAVYDFDYEKPGEGQRSKIIFFAWTPDTSNTRHKMIYTSSKDALRRELVGASIEVQGTEFSEVDYETVLDKALRTN
ncbi:hypothetical protein G6F46_007678 [Rhizopus delemar]|uniref:Cofilin n=3 Tax=Rhizopus TaxID=4842 RepID=I1C5V6_RHIO9|nr:hypothetical protein RO3G_08541 [Rhizopus delemar RA 99-880]KAG1049338.1 hypothetical protein G6F43_008331 [Rhizopus delemar]KAG1541457.1 hypothetical protein G6F51_007884 [Rhizopus arrhizus]KAG1456485.1 hypothetical protein G6F55_006478 [Rhizopus delemar]KAG1495551.1 hypothetical protein G6F54_007088 [Rhizopus delemar]|eukprot:EIE83836.1 hypothetical protein RO3G_08541 [Rhizopus delemar RA 99-880]